MIQYNIILDEMTKKKKINKCFKILLAGARIAPVSYLDFYVWLGEVFDQRKAQFDKFEYDLQSIFGKFDYDLWPILYLSDAC